MLLSINPDAISHFLKLDRSKSVPDAPAGMTARTYNKQRYVGIVIHDNAIQRGKPLETCKHVRATYQHFSEGLDWNKTEYLRLYEKKYKRQQRKRKIGKTFDDFCKQKLQKYDQIYKDMKLNGFRMPSSIENNIEVAISLSGEIFLIDGRHRLILAKILRLPIVPVVANLISESLAQSFVNNHTFIHHQLSKNKAKDRLKLLQSVPGGFRNKGVLLGPSV